MQLLSQYHTWSSNFFPYSDTSVVTQSKQFLCQMQLHTFRRHRVRELYTTWLRSILTVPTSVTSAPSIRKIPPPAILTGVGSVQKRAFHATMRGALQLLVTGAMWRTKCRNKRGRNHDKPTVTIESLDNVEFGNRFSYVKY